MQNYGTALEYANTAAQSAGTAQEKYAEAYLEGIDASLNRLTASWQNFSQNLLDSSLVTSLIDAMTVVSKVLNEIITVGDGFIAKIVAIVAAMVTLTYAFKKAGEAFKKAFGKKDIQLSMLETEATVTKSTSRIFASLKSLATSATTYITIFTILISVFDNKWAALGISIAGVVAGIVMAIITGIKTVDATTKKFMASNPIGWVVLALTAVVSLIKTIVDLVKQNSYESLKEEAKKAKDAWEEANNALQETKNRLAEIDEEIEKINGKEGLTLVDQEQLLALEQEKNTLLQQQEIQEAKNKEAQKEALEKAKEATDKYQDTHTKQYNSGWSLAGRIVAGVLTVGMSEIGYNIATNKSETQEEKFNRILGDWENATDEEKQYVTNYLSELQDLTSGFEYQVGDSLEDWQKEMNAYLDEYYATLDKHTLTNGNYDLAWSSIFSRVKFSGAREALQGLADDFNVTEDSLRNLYNSNTNVKEFIDYLISLGMFSWDDAEKVKGLISQVRTLNTTFKSTALQDYVSILQSLTGEYDALKDALDEVAESGVLSYDTISKLKEEYPLLFEEIEKYGDLAKGEDGYTLSEDALENYLERRRKEYAKQEAEAKEFLEEMEKAYAEGRIDLETLEAARTSYQNSKSNREEAEVAINTLTKASLIEDYQEMLEAQSDALDDQLDKYKDIIDIRKELLDTYKEELDYQKELKQKQKDVADLQTRLKLAQLDKSASGQAKVRELQEELDEAQEELSEYTLEHAIEDLQEEMDNEYNEYADLIERKTDAITEAINKAPKLTAEQLRELLKAGGETPKYHTGGFVGNFTPLKSNEEFAKLLNGELVVTPVQMSNFMDNTLPQIASGTSGVVNYNSPLIALKCDNVTKDSLPGLEKIVNQAVKKIKSEIDSKFSRSGKKGSIDAFTI